MEQQRRRVARLRAERDEAREALAEEVGRRETAREALRALEHTTPTGSGREAFHDAVTRLPAARVELREAVAAHDAAATRLVELERELVAADAELTRLEALADELEEAGAVAGADAARFFDLAAAERGAGAEVERLEEALRLERLAERLYRKAERKANVAMRMGYLDLLVGGLLSSWVKLSAADDAKRHADSARVHLWSLKRLVDDLPVATDIVPEITRATRFFDYAFDADLLSLTEISQLRLAVRKGRVGVVALHRRLRWLLRRALTERARLERERRALLPGVGD